MLPDSMKPVFVSAAAAADGDRVSWTGESGRVFEFRCCRNAPEAPVPGASFDQPITEEPVDDFTPVVNGDSLLREAVPDRDSVVDAGSAARIAWVRRQMSVRPDLAPMAEGAECLHQVPFTMCDPDRPGRLLRGTIDCIVRRPEGGVTVVQFKTGPPCEHDRRQLDLCVRAARELFAGRHVDGMLVYP